MPLAPFIVDCIAIDCIVFGQSRSLVKGVHFRISVVDGVSKAVAGAAKLVNQGIRLPCSAKQGQVKRRHFVAGSG